MRSAREGLDDEHGCAAVPTHEGWFRTAVTGAAIAGGRGKHGRRLLQESTNGSDVVPAVSIGEDPVVADAVKAGRQDVDQESADELGG